jgi:protein-tyrosine phosphatase/membrane-associated phospholipid phosphatase
MSRAIAAASRPTPRAAAWLLFLAPFFFASYGFATWWTSRRADVGAFVFDWERGVPFVPWTIVPYWSIDVCYGVSLFLCTSRSELDAHARRLLTAQLVAVACFLAWPLRFTFERPATGGTFGWLFDVLGSFDQPFNQAPSLHVALLVILWALYARHAAGAWRWVVHAWAALVGVSVLTTWQHHFIDVPTGALLGFACLWLWPIDGPSPLSRAAWTRDARRRQLALRYVAGAAACAAVAFAVGGAMLWALWGSVSLALVAANYAALGTAGFQKRDGRLSPAATALLLPYLGGARLNGCWWTRGQPPAVRVTDGVWIGRLPSRRDLERDGIRAIVDLSAELPVDAAGRAYANPAVLDLVAADADTLASAATTIERFRAHGPVLACCALGYSRSAAAVAAWLVASGRAPSPDAAIAQVAAVRPSIVLSDAHRAQLTAVRAMRVPAR